jgi:hypothetical protein
MNGQAWTTAEPSFGTMDSATDQSFGAMDDLINFDSLDIDLGEFNYNGSEYSAQGTPADNSASLHGYAAQNGGGQQSNQFAFDYSMQFSQAGTPVFPQAQDQIFQHHHGVPPTPNSAEIHGDPHRYMQHQQALFDQRYHMRKDDAVCEIAGPAVSASDDP